MCFRTMARVPERSRFERALCRRDRHRGQHAYAQRRRSQVSWTKGFSFAQIVFGSIGGQLRARRLVDGETVETAFVFNGDFDHARAYCLERACKVESTRLRRRRARALSVRDSRAKRAHFRRGQ